jgi:hypothetical protein
MTTAADEANQPVSEFEPGSLDTLGATSVPSIKFPPGSPLPGPPNLPPSGNYPDQYWRKSPAGNPEWVATARRDTGWTTSEVL